MKKIFIIAALTLAATAVISCDTMDNGRPQQTIKKEFKQMFPDAFDVEWEWEGRYWEVSFETGTRPNGTEHEAWFDTDGNWIRTKTEILLTAVPQQIKDYLAADPTYGSATFADNDADHIETPSGSLYRFDLRSGGSVKEVDVKSDGTVTLAGSDR